MAISEKQETQQAPRIVGTVQKGGVWYRRGDEEKLAKVLSQYDLDRLLKARRAPITGVWKSTKENIKAVATNLDGSAVKRDADGTAHGSPLKGLTDEQRAALPPLKAVRDDKEPEALPPDYAAEHVGAGFFAVTAPGDKFVAGPERDGRFKGKLNAANGAWAHYNTPPTE